MTKLSTKFARAAKRVTSLISATAIAVVGLVAAGAAPAQAAPVASNAISAIRSFSNGELILRPGEGASIQITLWTKDSYDISTTYSAGTNVVVTPNETLGAGLTISGTRSYYGAFFKSSDYNQHMFSSDSGDRTFSTTMAYTADDVAAANTRWRWSQRLYVKNTGSSNATYRIAPTVTAGGTTVLSSNYTTTIDSNGNSQPDTQAVRVEPATGTTSYVAHANDTQITISSGTWNASGQANPGAVCLSTTYADPTFKFVPNVTIDGSPAASSTNGETVRSEFSVQDNSDVVQYSPRVINPSIALTGYYIADGVVFFVTSATLPTFYGNVLGKISNTNVNSESGQPLDGTSNIGYGYEDAHTISTSTTDANIGDSANPVVLSNARFEIGQYSPLAGLSNSYVTPNSSASVMGHGNVNISNPHAGSSYAASVDFTNESGTSVSRACGPAAPTVFSASSTSSMMIEVTIPQAVAGATDYECAAFTSGSATSPYQWGQISETSRANNMKCNIGNLMSSTTYTVRVASKAYYEGKGAYSTFSTTATTMAGGGGGGGPQSYSYPSALSLGTNSGTAPTIATNQAIMANSVDTSVPEMFQANDDGNGGMFYIGPKTGAPTKTAVIRLKPSGGYDTRFGGSGKVEITTGTDMLSDFNWYGNKTKWAAIVSAMGMTPTVKIVSGTTSASTQTTKSIPTSSLTTICGGAGWTASTLMQLLSVQSASPWATMSCSKGSGLSRESKRMVISIAPATGAPTKVAEFVTVPAGKCSMNYSRSTNAYATGTQSAAIFYATVTDSCAPNAAVNSRKLTIITAAGKVTSKTFSASPWGTTSDPTNLFISPNKANNGWIGGSSTFGMGAPVEGKFFTISSTGAVTLKHLPVATPNVVGFSNSPMQFPIKEISATKWLIVRQGWSMNGETFLAPGTLNPVTGVVTTNKAIKYTYQDDWTSRNLLQFTFAGSAASMTKMYFYSATSGTKYSVATWTLPTS